MVGIERADHGEAALQWLHELAVARSAGGWFLGHGYSSRRASGARLFDGIGFTQ